MAGLKGQELPPPDDFFLAGLWVPPLSRPFGVHHKVAKSGYFHFLPIFQAAFDNFERRLYHIGSFLLGKTHFLVDAGNNFSFSHFRPLLFYQFMLTLSTARQIPHRSEKSDPDEGSSPLHPSASCLLPDTKSYRPNSFCPLEPERPCTGQIYARLQSENG